jgi:8-oxo-dGTP pyrophosphatase MutT (NUDIX family)
MTSASQGSVSGATLPVVVIARRPTEPGSAAEHDQTAPEPVDHGQAPADLAVRAAINHWGPPEDPSLASGWHPTLIDVDLDTVSGVLRVVYDMAHGRPSALISLKDDEPDLPARKVQRPGAYAVVIEGDSVLLTRYTRTGVWGLPGGGLDPGERPVDAVRREAYEEAGVALIGVRLVEVDSDRYQAPSLTDGTPTDFHFIRMIYRASVPRRTEPRVVEVGGSTDAAAWFPLADLDQVELTRYARDLIGRWGQPSWA